MAYEHIFAPLQVGSLTLENQGGETLLYYYEERGATLVEQPYTGIFRLEGSLEDLLGELA